MGQNPFRWVEIYVKDMDRARRFYESVFQMKLERLDTEIEIYAMPMNGEECGCGGALVKMEGVEPGCASVLPYFGCDDCAVQAAKAADYGGKIQKEKFSIGQYGFIAHVVDTEGNLIGLHSMG